MTHPDIAGALQTLAGADLDALHARLDQTRILIEEVWSDRDEPSKPGGQQ
jgi:hypothetical protein